MKPVSQKVIEAVIARLETITTVNGFNSDAGLRAHWAVSNVGQVTAATPALVIWRDPEQRNNEDQSRRVDVELQLLVDALYYADQANAGIIVEQIRADVIRAIEKQDNGEGRSLAESGERLVGNIWVGEIRPFARAQGVNAEGLQFVIEVRYPEAFADPYKVL